MTKRRLEVISQPAAARRTVQYMVGSSEWVLLADPAAESPRTLMHVARKWLDSLGSPPAEQMSFVPAPSADPRLGLAVLHHRRGRTAVYCPREDLAESAATALSLLAVPSITPLFRALRRCGPPRVRFTALRRSQMPAHLRPVTAIVRPPELRVYATAGLLSPRLALVLSQLVTGQLHCRIADEPGVAGLLRSVEQPSRPLWPAARSQTRTHSPSYLMPQVVVIPV